MRTPRQRPLIAALIAGALWACASEPHDDAGDPADPGAGRGVDAHGAAQAGPVPAPVLPSARAKTAPSEAIFDPAAPPKGAEIADVDGCDGCHADAVAQWRTSAHAFASFNNPAYRVSVDRFRAEVGLPASRHCGGCHDVALMVDGAMDRAVDPADRRAHTGVACRACHGITETRPDGNGSYTLTGAPIPIPREGDPSSLAQHKQRMTPAPLRTAAMCGSCHKAFLDASTGNARFFAGADDVTPWMRSEHAGSRIHRVDEAVPERACKDCHMPREAAPRGDVAAKQGTIASHRFTGGHSWLAAMRGDAAQIERVQAMLRGALRVDVAAAIRPRDGARWLPADGAEVTPGEALRFDVVVRNLRVGHRFPGGTPDSQDAWIEVTVDDARGRRVAEAGTDQEATGSDPSAHVLRAMVAGEDGVPLLAREVNRFRAGVVNHTVPPRDAALVEVELDVPAALDPGALPLRVTARLRHRLRTLALQRLACDDMKTARGRGFAGKSALDPCVAQPVTEIARSEVWIGAGWEKRAAAAEQPAWRRLLEHAFGLSHAVQERLDEARPSLVQALNEVGDAEGRGHVLAALAWLEAHEGRTDEAIRRIDEAAALLPGHPALAYLRGEALSLVWRWREAVAPLREAALSAPRDDDGWARLAIAIGSRGGDDRGALDAALQGLRVQPRDTDLLRIQALALGALSPGEAGTRAAAEAYEAFRPADFVPKVRSACSAKVPGCALERNPVHVHRMRVIE